MKKVKKKLLSGSTVVDSSSRKKHKGGLLVEFIKVVDITANSAFGGAAKSVSGDTTESESIDIEKEYLVEETSFQQESVREFSSDDIKIISKDLKRVVTKHTLRKPLGTINFDLENDDDDDILDGSLSFPLSFSFKHIVQVLVRKSFALDIDLEVVANKSSQEKLAYVRKIFSDVNGFGGASTLSKFGRIIRVSFTSEKAMIAAKLANDCDVVVNTNLKCPINNCTNWAIVLKEIPVEISVEAV
ncbi:hypothetical protein G9A89_021808 [Geosiphon pyriformis]|nr:hypothetical protein G9A89_021808 [Geosiphon pyriformis]